MKLYRSAGMYGKKKSTVFDLISNAVLFLFVQLEEKAGAKASLFGPLKPLHIYMPIGLEFHSLIFKQRSLLWPTGCQTAGVVDYTVTREITVQFRFPKYFAY